MTQSDNVITLMGIHEFNAISFKVTDNNGNFIRLHSDKILTNMKPSLSKRDEYGEEVYNALISWFKTLPLYYESSYL